MSVLRADTVTFACQKNTEVYVDGNLTLTGTYQHLKTASVENADGPCLLAFKTGRYNWKIVGSTSTGVVTDGSWKCIRQCNSFPSGWYSSPDFDDSSWSQARVLAPNNGTTYNLINEVSTDAKWIWHQENLSGMCCRKTLC